MDFLLSFLTGLLGTLTIGLIGKLAGNLFASEHSARVAGFALALGYAAGRYSVSGPLDRATAVAAAAAVGAIVAVILLWYFLLRRRQGGQVDD